MTTAFRPARRPVMLCVLDGWGWREDSTDNAVRQGRTPVFDGLWASQPRGFLAACEEDVGLPKGQMGNSEVGHMNLGAGRVVLQDIVAIDKAVAEGSLADSPALQDHIEALRRTGGTSHVMGLLSPGGVHSHQGHMAALVRAIAKAGVPVAVHAFTDGRDTPPQSAADYLARFLADIAEAPGATVATVSGRYFAMDRDKRWERVERAYRAIVEAEGAHAEDALAAVRAAYAAGTTDEFIAPTTIGDYEGLNDGDGVLFANFRSDRARELLEALIDPEFDGFERPRTQIVDACGMVEYSDRLNRMMSALFPPRSLAEGYGAVVAAAGLTQLRIAETEKYPHVTFFFNGGEETQFPGEDRILVPSPKVATYDLQPEMSAREVTDRVVEAIDSGRYDTIVLNYANPDMVGHTGDLAAAIKAVETVDACLGRVVEAVRRQGGALLVTADHGNCELMRDPDTGVPHTAHTLNKVPAVLVGGPPEVTALAPGRLADVAPTLLALLGLPQPAAMTGRSLLVTDAAAERAAE